MVCFSSDFAVELLSHFVSNLKLVGVDFLVSHVAIHMSIVDSEALALAGGFGVRELIDQLHVLR